MGRRVHTHAHSFSEMCPWSSFCAGCQADSLRREADETSKQKMMSEANTDMSCALILQTFGIRLEHRR